MPAGGPGTERGRGGIRGSTVPSKARTDPRATRLCHLRMCCQLILPDAPPTPSLFGGTGSSPTLHSRSHSPLLLASQDRGDRGARCRGQSPNSVLGLPPPGEHLPKATGQQLRAGKRLCLALSRKSFRVKQKAPGFRAQPGLLGRCSPAHAPDRVATAVELRTTSCILWEEAEPNQSLALQCPVPAQWTMQLCGRSTGLDRSVQPSNMLQHPPLQGSGHHLAPGEAAHPCLCLAVWPGSPPLPARPSRALLLALPSWAPGLARALSA